MSCYYVGLDVHKASICIAALNAAGKLVIESVVETSAATVLDLLKGLRGRVEVTFEEGTHAAWLYDVLQRAKAQVIVCDPRRNRLLRDGNKSDRVDALTGRTGAGGQRNTPCRQHGRSFSLTRPFHRTLPQKVQRLFGAKPLSYRDIEVEIKEVKEHPRADHLQAEVERLKPYIYTLRIHSDPNAQGLKRLRALTVKICQGANGSVLVGDDIYEFSLNEGDMILSGNAAYLCSNTESVGLLLEDAIIAHDVGEILARLLGIENGGDLTALAHCPPSRRVALLQRMLGIDPQPFLDEALLKLNMELEQDIYNVDKFLPPAPTTSQAMPAAITHPTAPQAAGILYSGKPRNQVGQVDVKQIQHIPSPPAKQIGQRVRATPTTGSLIISSREVTDAKRCQDLACSFEEAEGQDRYPLKVDHLQGSEFFGCDLLSFATPEDRAKFKSTLDEKLVLRSCP